jgi:hypothetical protein
METTPCVERALYLMLCDKELQRLDPLRTIAAKSWSFDTVELLLADGFQHWRYNQVPAAAKDRLLNMATTYMSNTGMYIITTYIEVNDCVQFKARCCMLNQHAL